MRTKLVLIRATSFKGWSYVKFMTLTILISKCVILIGCEDMCGDRLWK